MAEKSVRGKKTILTIEIYWDKYTIQIYSCCLRIVDVCKRSNLKYLKWGIFSFGLMTILLLKILIVEHGCEQIFHFPCCYYSLQTLTQISKKYLGSIDKLISQTLCNWLDVSKCRFARSSAEKPDRLVHTTQWWHIHSLTPHCTCTTNTSRVFSWPSIDDCIDQNLKWILEWEIY